MPMLTLACPIESRDETLTKDSKLLNCYWEVNASGNRVVVKRFGLTPSGPPVLPSTSYPYAQGLVAWETYQFAVTQDKLQRISSADSSVIPLPSPTISGQRLYCLSGILSAPGTSITVLQSTRDLWVLSSPVTVTKVTSPSYPAITVPGIAYLDGTYYVMDYAGAIYGSDLSGPLSWSALNFLRTDRGIGIPVFLARHLNYIAALCDKGVQFFYDAGNPAPGSPLLPSGNTLVTVGCNSADSVQPSGELLIFMAIDKSRNVTIKAFNGMALTTLSTPAVDRVLAAASSLCSSMVINFGGHVFYVLSLYTTQKTLAYDITTGDWAEWSSSADGVTDSMFTGALSFASPVNSSGVVLDRTSGVVYNMRSSYEDNNTGFIRALIRTKELDHDSTARKFLSKINVAGNTSSSLLKCRYSDDDGVTWSSWREIDMSTVKKQLNRLGSFYKRVFEFLQVDSNPLRLEGLILPESASPAVEQPELG